MAETQAERVARYIDEGRATKQLTLPDGGSVWRIDGDTGTYRLVMDEAGTDWKCTCPAALRNRKDCVHAWTVLKMMGLDPPEVPDLPVDMPVQDIDRETRRIVPPDPGTFADRANHDAGGDLEGTDPDPETDLAELVGVPGPEPGLPDNQRRDLIAIATAPVTYRTLEAISRTEFVPGALRGKPDAVLAAVLLGRDWNLGPLESLRMIDVIDGSPGPSAELLLRLYRRAGHTVEVTQADETAVVLIGRRGDTGESIRVSFTLTDAERAGLITVGDNGQPRARSSAGRAMPWESYTPDMLWNRAVARLVRRLAPDAMDRMDLEGVTG